MKKRDKIVQVAKAHLVARFGDRIRDVVLFGSRAWGRPKSWSDYDFVVVVRGQEYDAKLDDAICDVMADLDMEFDILTQTLVISEGELRHSLRGAQPIFHDALEKGIYA